MKQSSSEYLQRCLETLKADQNCSDETKVIMFNEYARLLAAEKDAADVTDIVTVLDEAQMEIREMYKRLGYETSNILESVDDLLAHYIKILQPPGKEESPAPTPGEMPLPLFMPEAPMPPKQDAAAAAGNSQSTK